MDEGADTPDSKGFFLSKIMAEGYIKLDRKIMDWEWYKNSNMFHVFVHLLLNANHKTGRFQGHLVKRGQLITGRLELAADVGLSEMQIRTCLKRLKSTGEVTIKPSNKFSIITICKYDTYQYLISTDNQQGIQQTNQQVTSNQPASNQQVTTNNNDNNDNNDKNDKNIINSQLWFLKFFNSTYQDYKSVFNGQSTSEVYFDQWKKFINFIYDNNFEDLFTCKFLSPHSFAKIVEKEKFTEDKWDPVLRDILSTGIKPEHDLFFRIPTFIKYSTRKNVSDKTKNRGDGKETPNDPL